MRSVHDHQEYTNSAFLQGSPDHSLDVHLTIIGGQEETVWELWTKS